MYPHPTRRIHDGRIEAEYRREKPLPNGTEEQTEAPTLDGGPHTEFDVSTVLRSVART